MNTRRDPDQLIRAFLAEGAEHLHDQVYDAVRGEIDHRRQRVVIGPWRLPAMNKLVPLGLGAAAVVVALVIGIQAFGPPSPGTVGGAQTASPSPSTAPTGLPVGAFVIGEPTDSMPGITVTIPASGWRHLPEFDALEKGVEVANLPEAAILVWPYPAGTGFYVPSDPCRSEATKPASPATSVDDLVGRLAAQASRDASAPTDVSVGGYAGKSITLHVPDDAVPSECEQGEFLSYGTEDVPLERYHQGPGQIDELWVIDVDGAIVVIDAMYRPDTSADLVEELRAIARSATFGT
mgnify:CR=1 FL=1